MEREIRLTEEEREAWRVCYAFHEEFADMDGSAEAWIRLAKKAGETDAKFIGNGPLMRHLLTAVIEYISDRMKEKYDGEERVEQVTMQEVIR